MANIPSHSWREPLAFPGDGAAPVHRPEASHGGDGHLLWVMVPLVYALVCWSLWGNHVVGAPAQHLVEATGIAVTAVAALLVVLRTESRSVRRERAYSTHLEELSQRLQGLAYHDSLTELYNHRYFYEQLTHEVERSGRYGRPVSLILFDLDNFKEVNDTYGHLMGDRLLAFVGKVIRDQVRGADIAARYGGDEFAIILPDAPRRAAEATARKLANAIGCGAAAAGGLSESLPLSVSFGAASYPDEARSISELLHAADTHLYAAKKARLLTSAASPMR